MLTRPLRGFLARLTDNDLARSGRGRRAASQDYNPSKEKSRFAPGKFPFLPMINILSVFHQKLGPHLDKATVNSCWSWASLGWANLA